VVFCGAPKLAIESSIETIRRVWIDDHYVLVRPWSEDENYVELCTEPGPSSQDFFGRMSITFGTPEG
jgi:hypothetical protein